MKKSERDQQRSRVYDWERLFPRRYGPDHRDIVGKGEVVPIAEAREFIADVWRRHAPFDQRNDPPFLQDGRGVTRGYATSRRINLPRDSRTKWYLLHELSHSLTSRRDWRIAGHGPEFVRTFVELLVRYDNRDRNELERTIYERRIKMATARRVYKRTGVRVKAKHGVRRQRSNVAA